MALSLRMSKKGFTLIEVMFAMTVLFLCLVLLFSSLITISFLQGLSQAKAKAVAQVTTVMESLNGLNYAGLLAFRPPSDCPLGASQTLVVECFKVDNSTVTLPTSPDALAQPLPNPVCVRCTLTWKDQRGRFSTVQRSGLYYR